MPSKHSIRQCRQLGSNPFRHSLSSSSNNNNSNVSSYLMGQ
jgi:hypothetical protein